MFLRDVSLKKFPAIGPDNPPPESIQVRGTHTHQTVRRLASNVYKPILVQEMEISAQARGWFICASLEIAAQHEIRPPEPQSSLLGARDSKPNPPTLRRDSWGSPVIALVCDRSLVVRKRFIWISTQL